MIESAQCEEFRQAMRRVASTVNVISIMVDGQPMGVTATAVSSISLDPPSSTCCAVWRSKMATLAPPGESTDPNRATVASTQAAAGSPADAGPQRGRRAEAVEAA